MAKKKVVVQTPWGPMSQWVEVDESKDQVDVDFTAVIDQHVKTRAEIDQNEVKIDRLTNLAKEEFSAMKGILLKILNR